MIGPKPAAPRGLTDAPVEGDACVFHMIIEAEKTPPVIDSVALLGPGRDYMTMEDAEKALVNFENEHGKITSTLHGPYSTMTALVADFPEAKMEGIAKRLLAAEQARDGYRAEIAEWEARVEAAGLEPCDRCGGAGGWVGWPGFTCYDCGGRGTQEPGS